ncbi:MAG: bifunctional 2-dehydro-3-deoxyphosphogluconate aldolase / (4S)-4-hydroxy-2-oxoglutarate aldolase Eda [Idiomarinaceae bacterium HL-53]|nr:MAG: bifunctional 2-dehydro-3-deoxyphosphogluconate aldolase / (4S)-4-hydroxy-2-oxoglutarate aldolase Eda [Idiomarinaceae bacterium HL-53]CUS47351.1 2-dehydro-3-deoxyphosphogluconate aldolase / (4S)-4-hydroxy-2-oxoglutarate aldolase [Idiomarinaceae bacterium HL-53]
MSFSRWQIQPEELMTMTPIVPVIVIEDIKDAVPLATALVEAGVSLLEVTLRSAAAIPAIKLLRKELPRAVVGAGTVTTPEELEAVEAAGAQFAISPGITENLLAAGARGTMPLIPGIATISELMLAKSYGYTHLKFFPAEAAGGTAMLKSIAGPFPQIKFCPTGGIHQGNFQEYLKLPNVMCVGGSWILPKEAIQAKDWQAVKDIAVASVRST